MISEVDEAPAGRPRDPRIEAACLEATRDLLVEVGYAGLTMTAVAERAGTTKAALYRRWPALPALVYEAAFPDELLGELSFGGTLYDDLHHLIFGSRDAFLAPVPAAALPGLLAEFSRHPDLHATLRLRFAPVNDAIDDRLTRGRSAGEVRDGVNATDLLNLIVGAILSGLLLGPTDLDDSWVDRLTTTLVKGLHA